jgi:hypothetical protein
MKMGLMIFRSRNKAGEKRMDCTNMVMASPLVFWWFPYVVKHVTCYGVMSIFLCLHITAKKGGYAPHGTNIFPLPLHACIFLFFRLNHGM